MRRCRLAAWTRRAQWVLLLFSAKSCSPSLQQLGSTADDCVREPHAGGPHTVFMRPVDGALIPDYRGGGNGMRVSVQYVVRNLPCGGSSRPEMFFYNLGLWTIVERDVFDRWTGQKLDVPVYQSADVNLEYPLLPGSYRIEVTVKDSAGHDQARDSAEFEIEMPEYARSVRVAGTADTLAAISHAISNKRSGAYLRFGDGDLHLAGGAPDQMQKADAGLQEEVRAALAMHGENVFKGLMLNAEMFGAVEQGMVDGNHLISDALALGLLEQASEYWRPTPISNVYSNAALAHAACHFPELAVEFLLDLRHARPLAFVGNQNVPPVLLAALFGPQVVHVRAPPSNAYSHIEEMYAEILELIRGSAAGGGGGGRVVVLMAGSTGLALQQRLHATDVFTFDFGSLLDSLSEFQFRGGLSHIALQKSPILPTHVKEPY